jgi:NAD(P)-dependent dehydrogenase (short-subunit alcohol dehydrogenase family)
MTQSCVITGAARGIGRAISERLTDAGHVVAIDRDQRALAWIGEHPRVTGVPGDAGSEADAARAADIAEHRWRVELTRPAERDIRRLHRAAAGSNPVSAISRSPRKTTVSGLRGRRYDCPAGVKATSNGGVVAATSAKTANPLRIPAPRRVA